MFMWGKIQRPSADPEAKQEKFYYSTNAGQIVSDDGSGYVIPAMSELSAEKTDFVPLEFAHNAIKVAVKETLDTKENYQKYLEDLKITYRKNLNDTRAQYEELIREMKQKALRHVEIQQTMRKTAEDKLTKELRTSDELVDEMRDSLATLNGQYQEEVRALKQKLSASERLADQHFRSVQDLTAASEAGNVLHSLVAQVTENVLVEAHREQRQDSDAKQLKLKRTLKEQMRSERLKIEALVASYNEDSARRREVGLVLTDVLRAIEITDLDERRAQAAGLQGSLQDLHAQAESANISAAEQFALMQQTLLEQHDSTKRQSAAELSASQRRHERAEVEACLGSLLASVIEHGLGHSLRAAYEAHHEQQKANHDAQLAALRQQYSEDVAALQLRHQQDVEGVQAQYAATIEQLRAEPSTVVAIPAALQEHTSQPVESESIVAAAATPNQPTVEAGAEGTASPEKVLELERANQDLLSKIATLEAKLRDAPKEQPTTPAEAPRRLSKPPVGTPTAGGLSDEMVRLRAEEKRLGDRLDELAQSSSSLRGDMERLNAAKEANKGEIKEWTRLFIETHEGREPDNNDKVAIKDKYQSYKALSVQAKELEGRITAGDKDTGATKAALAEVKDRIAKEHAAHALRVEIPPVDSAPVAGAAAVAPAVVYLPAPKAQVATADAEVQATEEEAPKAVRKAISFSVPAAEGATVVEQLEDEIYALRAEYEKAAAESKKLEGERNLFGAQLEALIKEKRTDVVRRFELEVEELQKSSGELREQLAELKAAKVKGDTKLEELKGRAEAAETELRERDKREMAALNPTEEKSQLKGQINKQRDAIILKSKAATAGWDAAANADEKLDVEVLRAYKKGAAEEREQHKGDLAALNLAVEAKETRITELMVAIGEMERKVFKSDAEVATMREMVESMKLEVADTIASLSSLAGTGGSREDGEELVIGPTAQELESAREALDAAQDELVAVTERCEKLEADLEVSRKKNRLYDRLAQTTGVSAESGAGALQSTKSKVTFASGVSYDLGEVILSVKKAILKGTNLWKSNKKDDCYDVYLDSCQETFDRLLTAELKNPLGDAMTHGKSQGQQNKQRGSVVLRKALDKFLSDSGQSNLRKAEDDAARDLTEKKRSAAEAESSLTSSATADIKAQLEAIDSGFLEQGYTRENNPSNTTDLPSPRGNNASASSLLMRARAAEEQVASMKKQLAAVIAATTAQPAEGAARPSTGSAKGAAAMVAPVRKSAVSGGGADQAEVRKLNRRVKELEAQVKAGGPGTGGGGGAVDQKALQASEKAAQKKIKELETNSKREAKALEMRATKAENALSKIQSTYNAITAERDALKAENDKLFNLSNEVNSLRAKAERCEEIEVALTAKTTELAVVNEAFKKETTLRKKYKNELEDLKGAIRVYARCRPMARYELEKGCKSVVEIKDETSMKVVTTRGEKDFEFDAVFSATSTQDAVFEDTKRLVESCMDGFNVCLFAYGQTGSGKTFTMTGSPSMPGLTPKAIDELFRLITERKHLNVKVTTYFVELYNDNLVDLYWVLDNKGAKNANQNEPPKLDIKMDAKKMVFIRNSVIKDVSNAGELMDLFNKGNLERHTGATKMNAESSRSHSIFSIMVEAYDTTSKRTTTGKLSLVDLAGSERADKTGAGAERLKEAQNINKSLSALGDVIAALSEGEKFIPYRNNKLTQLMQDSLGGNAKTLMFVNFSPADYNADETSTSLMYAARVKKIVNNASKQAESAEVARLKGIIKRLMAGASAAEVEADLTGGPAEEMPVIDMPDDGKVYDGY